MSTEHADGRVRALDAYRGVAVLLMIAAHVCDAFLDDRYRAGGVWHAVNVLFGFVAPAFLTLAGASLGLALRRSEHREAKDTSSLSRRYALLLLLAYWLQIPVLSLRQLVWNQRPDELTRMFDSNILHVLSLGCLVLLALQLTDGARRRAHTAAAVMALATLVAAPYVWHSDVGAHAWLPVRAFVSPQPFATFPLVPHIAYVLAGFTLAPLVAQQSRRAVSLIAVGAAMLASAALTALVLGAHAPHDDFWNGSIQHSLMRAGAVVIGAGAVLLVPFRGNRPSILERIGRASLAIYVLHLMVVYGSPMTIGLRSAFGRTLERSLSPLVVMLLFVVIAAVVSAAAVAWPVARRRWPVATRTLWWSWWALFAALFVLTP